MSSSLSFRVYPRSNGRPLHLLREGVLLAPYAVLLLTSVALVFSTLSGWMLWLVAAAMVALHVYLTTDLLLPHWRKAEVMGYGLKRSGEAIRFTGYAGRRPFFRGTTAVILRVDEHPGRVEVVLGRGRAIGLEYLSPPAQELFVRAYRAMAAGASRSELLSLDPGIRSPLLRAPRFDDGIPRPYRRVQAAVILLMFLPELWAARHLAAWVRPLLLA